MEEKGKIPEIRFKGFSDAWEVKELAEIGGFKNGMNFGKEDMGHGYPFVNLQNVFGQVIVDNSKLDLAVSTENQRKEYSLHEGDVLFIRSSVKPAGVGETAIVPKLFKNTTYSGFIIRFRPVIEMDKWFNSFVYSIKNVRKQIISSSTSSANTNINQGALKKIELKLPKIKEQKKLGTYFQNLDKLITLHQKKYDKLVTIKKAMLEKMFPQEGADVPEIRFNEFSRAWEENDLFSIIDLRSGRDYKHLSSGDIPVYGTGGYMLSVDGALSYDEDAIGIGRKGTIDKPYILRAPFWTVDTLFYSVPKEENELNFIYCLFQKINWKQKDESTGVPSLSKVAINSIPVITPAELEQEVIGEFFKEIDNLLGLQQQQLEKLKNIKKACLEKMFV